MSPAARDDRTAVEVLDEWRDVLVTTRHITAPPLIAAALGAAGLAAWLSPIAAWTYAAVTAWGLFVGFGNLAELPQRSAVPAPGEKAGRARRLWLWSRRNLERVALGAALVTGAGWSWALALLGPSWGLAAAALVLLAPLWAAWWRHRRVRIAVKVEHDVAAWGDGSRVGLPGTTARGLNAGDGWFRFRAGPGSGEGARLYTQDDYRQAVARIAALFRVRARDVTMAGDSKREAEVVFTVRTKERETVTPELDLTMDRIAGPKRLGTTDDGEVVHTAQVLDGREGIGTGGQHGIGVGVTGSGKSSHANKEAEIAARALDQGLIVWDFSYGAAELRAWAPCAWWFCTTPAEAVDSLRWLTAYAEHRGARMKGRFHRPSRKRPGATIVADELASMFAPQLLGESTGDPNVDATLARLAVDERIKVWEPALRLFRKYAFAVKGFTQYGRDDALGGEVAKQQLGLFRSIFRTNRDFDASQVVPLTVVRPSLFPQNKPGTCHLLGPTVPEGGQRLRVDFRTDEQITRMVEAWKDHQPQPEAPMTSHPLWLARPTTAPTAEVDDLDGADAEDGDDSDDDHEPADAGGDEVVAEVVEPAAPTVPAAPAGPVAVPEPAVEAAGGPVEAPRRRMVATDATLDATWGALAGQGWVSSGELASVLSYSTRYASKLLGQLAEQGRAERKGAGRSTKYQAVPREQWPSGGALAAVGSGSGAGS